jgi:hypothetical protein
MIRYLAPACAMFALSFANEATAAKKCSFEVDNVDKFTKVETRRTWWEGIDTFEVEFSGKRLVYVAGLKVDDDVFLAVKYEFRTRWKEPRDPTNHEMATTIVIPRGSPLLILLDNDSLIELAASESASVHSSLVYDEGRRFIKSAATVRYALDEQTALTLTQHKATDVRLVHRDGEYDVEVGKKSVNDIKKAVRCAAGIEKK